MRAKLVYEKFFPESDPVKDLGVGLVEKIRRALNGITKDKTMIDFLGKPIITSFGYRNGKLIGYLEFSMPDDAPYIKNSFEKFDIADYVIFKPKGRSASSSFYFTLKIKPEYQKFFQKALSISKVNEKFTEKSDPIKDLKVGKEHFREELRKYDIYHAFPRLRPEYRKNLESEFGCSAAEIYYLGYVPSDPTAYDTSNREVQKHIDTLIDLTSGAKQIHSTIPRTKRGHVIRVYKTKFGRVATIQWGMFDSGLNYVGDIDVALRIYNKINTQ